MSKVRFAEYSKNAEEGEHEQIDMNQIYQNFKDSIANIVNKQQGNDIQLHKLLELQAAFIKFCVHTFPDKIEYVDQILQLSVNLCGKVSPADYTDEVLESIAQILIHPLETMSIVVLNLAEYPKLMNYLPFLKRKRVASKIVEAVVNSRTYLITESITSKLISFIVPLVEEQDDAVQATQEELESDLLPVSRMVGFVESHDPLVTEKMLDIIDEKVKILPAEWRRLLLPALVTGYCRVAHRVVQVKKLLGEEESENLIRENFDRLENASYLSQIDKEGFSFKLEAFEYDFMALFTKCREQIDDLGIDFPKTAIKLGLQLALLVNVVDPEKEFDEFQADLCSETLELYQDEIVSPKEKVFYLEFIIGTFCQINNLTDESRESLYRNTTTFASSLLKKKDKVLMLLKASNLYMREGFRDEDRVSEILKKALKFAKNGTKRDVENAVVYVHILDKIIYLLEKDSHSMTAEGINICMGIINENLPKVSSKSRDSMEDHLGRLTTYLRKRKAENPEKYGEANV